MSRRISQEFLQQVKAANDALAIIGEHVVLRKAGREYVGLCPFHSERSGSFYVNADKQVYHCHGCHASGDVVKFTQEIHGVSFVEAVKELADRARIALPREAGFEADGMTPEQQKAREEKLEKIAVATKLNRFVAEYYFQNLRKHPFAQDYVSHRGLNADWIRQFYVGYASRDWDALARHLGEKKAPLPLAEELGLIRRSTRQAIRPGEAGHFDLFRNRVVFPILDTRGRVVGFGGRTLPGVEEAGTDTGPKYLNSTDSILFKKSRLAYGLFQAQKHIREKDEVIVVEGYFDVIALHAAGFENVVATCGTSLTIEHIDILKRFGKKFTLLFDADAAGDSATVRAMELGLEQGVVFHSATLPKGKDPDEILFDLKTGAKRPEGQAEMGEILHRAEPVLDAMISKALSPDAIRNSEDRADALRQIAGWMKKLKDPVGRALRIETLQAQHGVSPELLKQMGLVVESREQRPQEMKRPERGYTPPVSRVAKTRMIEKLSERERSLLQGLAFGGKFHEKLVAARSEMPPLSSLADLFDYAPARDWVQKIAQEPGVLEKLRSHPASLIDPRMDPQVLSTLTEAWVRPTEAPSVEEFDLSLRRSLARVWARFSQELRLRLADAEAKQDAGLQAKVMQDYLDVQRKLKEFNNFYDEA